MDIQFISLFIFLLLSACNLILVKNNKKIGKAITKALLMPMLTLYYVFSTANVNYLVVLALLCGFLGDVLLLAKRKLFVFGMLSFFAGHIFYIMAFIWPALFNCIPLWFYLLILPYVICGIMGLRLLWNHITPIRIYAAAYMLVISAMSFSALTRVWYLMGSALWLPYLGSILFIVSDSILAYNRFYKPIVYGDVYVMSTYIAAQFLIVQGFII